MKNIAFLIIFLCSVNLFAAEISLKQRSDDAILLEVKTDSQGEILTAKSPDGQLVYNSAVKNGEVNIPGLRAETEYQFALSAEGKQTAAAKYKTLAAEPQKQASSIAVKNVNETGFTMFFTRGSGSGAAVFIMPEGTEFTPVDGVEYPVKYLTDSAVAAGKKVFCVFSDSCESNYPIRLQGLSGGKSYIMRIFEYNGSGECRNYLVSKAVSNPRTITSGISSPIAIPAEKITKSGFTARWEKSFGAETYLFDLATDMDFKFPDSFFNSADVGGVTSIDITDLTPGTYYYRVRAVGKISSSAYSNTIKVRVQ